MRAKDREARVETAGEKGGEARPRTRGGAWAQAGAPSTHGSGQERESRPLQKHRAFAAVLLWSQRHVLNHSSVRGLPPHAGGTRGGSTTNRPHAVVRSSSSALGAGDTRAKRTQAGGRARGQAQHPWASLRAGLLKPPTVHVPRDRRRGTIWSRLEARK